MVYGFSAVMNILSLFSQALWLNAICYCMFSFDLNAFTQKNRKGLITHNSILSLHTLDYT